VGTLKRFNLNRIIRKYNISYLFETGTWKGDSIAYAQKHKFKRIYSSEIVKEIADKAKERFRGNDRIEIIEQNSTDALRDTIGRIDGNCLFWLDAHFPGAEEGLSGYNETKQEEVKLPLEKEIGIIADRQRKYRDVIIIDDLRIYEDGPFRSGNMPKHILPPKARNIRFLESALSATHIIQRSYWDEGYIIIFPNTVFPEDYGWPRMRYGLYSLAKKKIY
jgi:hypothetical protein